MTLLAIVQDAMERIGLPEPSGVIGSTDGNAVAMRGLAQQEGRELQRRHDWQALIKEKTFTATATEEQASVLPDDFDRMVPKTFWNRTQDRPVAGPISPQRWQLLKSGLIILPWDGFRIRASSLLMNPTPSANDSMVFEYVSKNWCGAGSETSPTQTAFQSDTDEAFLDQELMTLGLIWRFRKARGLSYAEDYKAYQHYFASLAGTDGEIADVDMGTGDDGSAVVDPYVTDGNWTVN